MPPLLLQPLSHACAHTAQANNHVVREGACHCIAEMAAKLDPAAVASHVPVLLTALLSCFSDESWPVRDAACVASGRFAAVFTVECRPQLDALFELWFKHCAEPIWSVREDSAAALGQVCTVLTLQH
jgi:HEAT repeat